MGERPMMNEIRTLLVAAITPALTTCCPSVWLTVHRVAPEPLRISGLPSVEGPIPVPLRIPNKFEHLRIQPDDDAAAFFDEVHDPAKDLNDEHARAVHALDALLRQRPGAWREVVTGTTEMSGTIECNEQNPVDRRDDAPDWCRDLRVSARLERRPSAVWIDGNLVSVTSCTGTVDSDAYDTQAQPPVPVGACASPSDRGTDLVLSRALPLAAGKVAVVLADAVTLSRPLISFVHLSDIQLRDANIKVGDRETSARLDQLIPSFQYDPDQELYNEYVVNAVVATINADVKTQPPELRPRFMIHTGDTIDAGTHNELMRAHAILDQLTIPWFNVIGNHDVLAFGNMQPTADLDGDASCVGLASLVLPYSKRFGTTTWLPNRICIRQQIEGAIDDAFVATPDPIDSRAAFVAGNGHPKHAAILRFADAKIRTRSDDKKTCRSILSMNREKSLFHGFDLQTGGDTADAKSMPGYYAFTMQLNDAAVPGRRAVFIVLNTEDLDAYEGGNIGRLQQTQLDWLDSALRCVGGTHDLVFVFGHHPLAAIRIPGGKTLHQHAQLAESKNVVAYLYGHAHKHGLCREKSSCEHFWEIEAGSLLEFPQEGKMIRVKALGPVGFIEMTTFTERLSSDVDPSFRRYVERARRGAERDFCHQYGNRCAEDGTPRREDGDYTHARLFFEMP